MREVHSEPVPTVDAVFGVILRRYTRGLVEFSRLVRSAAPSPLLTSERSHWSIVIGQLSQMVKSLRSKFLSKWQVTNGDCL
jgi:hypothetical protein